HLCFGHLLIGFVIEGHRHALAGQFAHRAEEHDNASTVGPAYLFRQSGIIDGFMGQADHDRIFPSRKVSAAIAAPRPYCSNEIRSFPFACLAASGAVFAHPLIGEGRFDETDLITCGGDIMKWLFASVAGVVLTLSAASNANAQVLWGSRAYYN